MSEAPKIMIVEDSQETAELLQVFLKHQGYKTCWVADGLEALALAKEENPDLILMDVTLPGMDGYSIQNQFGEDETTKNIPIIVMTSKGEMRELFETASNVVGFVQKPFNVKDLFSEMKSILSEKKK